LDVHIHRQTPGSINDVKIGRNFLSSRPVLAPLNSMFLKPKFVEISDILNRIIEVDVAHPNVLPFPTLARWRFEQGRSLGPYYTRWLDVAKLVGCLEGYLFISMEYNVVVRDLNHTISRLDLLMKSDDALDHPHPQVHVVPGHKGVYVGLVNTVPFRLGRHFGGDKIEGVVIAVVMKALELM
jgi:hypothetical protein